MSSELIKYIKRQLELGATREQLISHLVAYGWSEEVVRDLMDDVIETPSAEPLKKFVLPSLTLITLVAILGFMLTNNNITGTTTFDTPSVCLYAHGGITEKFIGQQCCDEAKSASNCQQIESAYYVNNRYTKFTQSCSYNEGSLLLSKEIINSCNLNIG